MVLNQRTRRVEWQTEAGTWSKGRLEEAARRLNKVAMVRTKMEVPLGKQEHPRQQEVDVEISACSFQLAYHREVRRPSKGPDQILRKDLWLGPRASPQLPVGPVVVDHRLAGGNRS